MLARTQREINSGYWGCGPEPEPEVICAAADCNEGAMDVDDFAQCSFCERRFCNQHLTMRDDLKICPECLNCDCEQCGEAA